MTDSETRRAALQAWLTRRAPEVVPVEITSMNSTGGLSHEMFRIEVTWRRSGRVHVEDLIVRLDPAHFRKRRTSNLRREFEVQSVLGKRRDVPVPQVYWFEEDEAVLGAAFYVMQCMPGRPLLDRPPFQREGWLVDLPAADRAQVWRSAVMLMGKLHAAPASAFSSLRPTDQKDEAFSLHVRHWREHYDWAMDGVSHPTAESAWKWLLSKPPRNRPLGVSWGDARYANFLFDGLSCSAMLDWEDVSLSSPLFDLGRWFVTEALHEAWGYPRLDGLGDRESTLALWEACSGLSSADLHWYVIFNAVCAVGLAVRTQRLLADGRSGPLPPNGFNPETLDRIIEQWLERARSIP